MASRIADRTLRDIKAGLRSLRRAPSFTATAVVVLAMGIGIATAVATVVRAVVLTPLPVTTPDQVVLLHALDSRGTDLAMTFDEFKQLRAATHTMTAVVGEAHFGASATTRLDGDRPLVLRVAWVTGNFFDVLGVRPALGRLFHAEDESLDEPSVAVISYATWHKQFAGDTGVIGRRLTDPYSRKAATIVGVAPAGLDYPSGVEYWSPWVYAGGLDVIGRVSPSSTAAAAGAEFAGIMRDIYGHRPVISSELAGTEILTLPGAVLRSARPPLLALSAAGAMLLAIACVNVGGLLLLRLAIRRQEITVRRALGAGTSDILRLLVAESGLLALGGGIMGYGLSWVLLGLLPAMASSSLPRLDLIASSGTPLIAIAITLLVVVLIGALPGLGARQVDLATPLRLDSRSGGGASAHRHVRRWFVAFQVAIALVLLSGAGLVARSLERLEHIDLGFRADHLSLLTLAPPVTRESVDSRFASLLDRVTPALQGIPGIRAVTPIEIPPFFGPGVFNTRWEVEGQPPARSAQSPRLPFEVGGPDYFKTFDIPLLRGRGFLDSDRDSAPKVAVVSEGAARALSLGDAVGARIRSLGDTNPADWRRVVGVAGDVHFRTLRNATPAVYLPARQWFFQGIFAVRTVEPLSRLLPVMQRGVGQAYAGTTIIRAETMDDLLESQVALPRLSTSLLAAFSMGALLLAAVGLYGVVASTVRERTRELGIRAVLGATPGDLRRQILREAFFVYAGGAGAGLAIALALTRFLRSLLFQVSPFDPATLLAAIVILLLVAMVAALAPAHRATRIDPARALRVE